MIQPLLLAQLVTCLLFSSFLTAQDCTIFTTPIKPLHFDQKGLIGKRYQRMKTLPGNNYQIMLINFREYSHEAKSYYLSIDSNNHFKLLVESDYYVLFSDSIIETEKYNSDFVSYHGDINGFFIGGCKRIVTPHKKQILIVCNNALNLWIEYLSTDGHMKEALETNTDYAYLKEVYKMTGDVFKDAKYSIKKK